MTSISMSRVWDPTSLALVVHENSLTLIFVVICSIFSIFVFINMEWGDEPAVAAPPAWSSTTTWATVPQVSERIDDSSSIQKPVTSSSRWDIQPVREPSPPRQAPSQYGSTYGQGYSAPPPQRDYQAQGGYNSASHGGGSGWNNFWNGPSNDMSYSSYGGASRPSDRMNALGQTLHDITNWNVHDLPPVKKDFYIESASTRDMPREDVEEYRSKHRISISEPSMKPLIKFSHAMLPAGVDQELQRAGYEYPSPIQAQGWPVALRGRDMVGIARTGSGKTLAYGIPAIVHIGSQEPLRRGDGPIVLCLGMCRYRCIFDD